MATYGSAIITCDKYHEFQGIFSDTTQNNKEYLFYTDNRKFVIDGFDVTVTSTQVTVTPGRAVVNTELIVVPNTVTISKDPGVTDFIVALELLYPITPWQDGRIVLVDNASFNTNNMLVLAAVVNNVPAYKWDPASPYAAVSSEQRIQLIWDSLILQRAQYTISTATSTTPLLLTYISPQQNIFVYVNGILVHEGTDYTLDTTNMVFRFVDLLQPGDVVEQEYVQP